MHSTHDRPSALPWQAAFAAFATTLLFFAYSTAVFLFNDPGVDVTNIWGLLREWSVQGFFIPVVIVVCATLFVTQWSVERFDLRGYRPAWPMLLTFVGIDYALGFGAGHALFHAAKALEAFDDPYWLRPHIIVRAASLLLVPLQITIAWFVAMRIFRHRAINAPTSANQRLRAATMFGLGFLSVELAAYDMLMNVSDVWFDFSKSPWIVLGLLPGALLLWGLAFSGAWFGLPASMTTVRPGRLLLAVLAVPLTCVCVLMSLAGAGVFMPREVALRLSPGDIGFLLTLSQVIGIPLFSLGFVRLLYGRTPGAQTPVTTNLASSSMDVESNRTLRDDTGRLSTLPWKAAFAMLVAMLLALTINLFSYYVHAARTGSDLFSWGGVLSRLWYAIVPTMVAMCAAGFAAQRAIERFQLRGYQPAWPLLSIFGGTYLVLFLIGQTIFPWLIMILVGPSDTSKVWIVFAALRTTKFALTILCAIAAWSIATYACRRQAVIAPTSANHRLRAAVMYGLAFLCIQSMVQDLFFSTFFPESGMLSIISSLPWIALMVGLMLVVQLAATGLAGLGAWFGLPPLLAEVHPGRLLLAALLTLALTTGIGTGASFLLGSTFMARQGLIGMSLLAFAQWIVAPLASLGVVRLFYRNADSASPA